MPRRKVVARVLMTVELGHRDAELLQLESRRLARRMGLSVATTRIRRLGRKPKSTR